MQLFVTLLTVLLLSYGLICAGMFLLQRKLLYHPVTDILSPQQYGLPQLQTHKLTTSDGETVLLWYAPSAHTDRPIIVYFHGNAGHMGDRAEKFAGFLAEGYGLAAVSYRGYGTSSGHPSEEGLYLDARAAFAFLSATANDMPLLIYGESLGSGVAVQMALEHAQVRALVLEAPYRSITAVASGRYPFIPVHFLLRDQFDSERKLPHVQVPLLLFHGEMDELIPVSHGKALFELANTPKQAYFLQGIDHTSFDPAMLSTSMNRFLDSL